MAQRVAGLYIDLGLNSQGFESGLREAGRSIKKFGDDAGGQSGKITNVFASMASNVRAGIAGATMLAGGVAAVGATTVISQLRSTSAAVAEIGAEAKKAGVSAEELQELGYAAQQVKVSTDALTDGLKEMQLRADEFALTGKGSGAEAFERLGYTADGLKEKLKDPAALFKEIIGRLKQLDTAAQIRVSDEIFGGTGGEQFVRFLGEGVKTLDEFTREAQGLGIVIDNDLVAKAGELDAQFNKISMVLDMRMKGAIIGVAAEFDRLYSSAQSFMTSVGNWDGWKYLRMGGSSSGVTLIDPNDPMSVARNALANGLAQGQRGQLAAGTSEDWVWTPNPNAGKPADKPKKEPRASSRLTPGQEFERSIDSIREQIAALEMEQQALDMTAYEAERLRVEHQLLAEARRMGVEMTPEIEARIKSEAAAYASAVDKLEQARTKAEDVRELQEFTGQALANSISGLIDGTKTLNDVLADLVGNLADAALQAALLGQGPLASLLGGGTSGGLMGALFSGLSGGFSEGGYTGDGGKFAPAGIVHRGEYVFDKAATSRIGVAQLEALRRGGLPGYASGGPVGASVPALRMPVIPQLTAPGASMSISAPLHIDARGANMTAEQMQAAVGPMFAEHTRQLQKAVPGWVEAQRGRTATQRRT